MAGFSGLASWAEMPVTETATVKSATILRIGLLRDGRERLSERSRGLGYGKHSPPDPATAAGRYNRGMPGNSFGKLFRVTTAGVSHGPGYLCIIDGCPPGLPLSVDDLLPDLERRRPGQSKIVSQRAEEDLPEIWSGVFEGKTDGTPIGLLFRNADQRSADYSDIADKYRPGHADFTFDAKFGFRDYRGGGRSSARETLCRVAAGAVAKKLLAGQGVRVLGYVKQVGDVRADIPEPAAVTLAQVEANAVRCPEPAAAVRMIELIEAVRKDRDSIGGVCELVAVGVPAGWG